MAKTAKTICVLGPRPRGQKTELGESAGHPFRGNQHTGGTGSSGWSAIKGPSDETVNNPLYNAANAWSGDMLQTDLIQTAADAQVQRGEFLHSSESSTAGMAEAMIRGVQEAPPNPEPLYRGINVPVADTSKYTEGASVDFSLGSFSMDRGHASSFAEGPQGDPVLFHIDAGDAQAVDLRPLSPVAEGEKEFVTGGSFVVTSVTTEPPANPSGPGWKTDQIYVGLKQTATPDVK